MHDPFAGFPVSCDWACHRARGSAGGTDYGVSVGTPVRAAFAGTLRNRPPVQYPRSGNVAILTRSDGLAFYHLHLSRFVTSGAVKEGDIIGYSGGAKGAPGSGSSTGPHLHVNAYLHGVVRDIHDFFTTTAGNGGTEIDMPLDAADKQFLNELGAAIVQQISGSAPAIYGTGGPTIEQVRADLGYLRDTTFKSIQESVSALTVDGKGTADIAPLLAAINALPAQTATAVKAALKAAL